MKEKLDKHSCKGKHDCKSYMPNVKNLGLGGKVHPPELRKKKKRKSFAEALQN